MSRSPYCSSELRAAKRSSRGEGGGSAREERADRVLRRQLTRATLFTTAARYNSSEDGAHVFTPVPRHCSDGGSSCC